MFVFQFIVGRMCRHAGGALALSPEHGECAWMPRAESLALGFPPSSGYRDAIARLWQAAEGVGNRGA
ncbi:MAG TPA: hypothetical protein PK264_22760, partial [Hyphomicrobiaceae bacterium]|nr:hypothetical protein [Hyphomicrobiaceae bacterium]